MVLTRGEDVSVIGLAVATVATVMAPSGATVDVEVRVAECDDETERLDVAAVTMQPREELWLWLWLQKGVRQAQLAVEGAPVSIGTTTSLVLPSD